jgi:hypothetical protein
MEVREERQRQPAAVREELCRRQRRQHLRPRRAGAVLCTPTMVARGSALRHRPEVTPATSSAGRCCDQRVKLHLEIYRLPDQRRRMPPCTPSPRCRRMGAQCRPAGWNLIGQCPSPSTTPPQRTAETLLPHSGTRPTRSRWPTTGRRLRQDAEQAYFHMRPRPVPPDPAAGWEVGRPQPSRQSPGT